MIIDRKALSRQLIEFDERVERMFDDFARKHDVKLLLESIPVFSNQIESLIKNDRESLILLQRLQRSVGTVIVQAPNLLFHNGMLETAVNISPDPALLDSAIRFGLFHLMLGTNESGLRDLVVEAVRLGGICFKDISMLKPGIGFHKDYEKGFVPWKGATKEQLTQAALATDVLTRLFENTLEHAYGVSPDVLADNLQQILCGLIYFGGEVGTRSALRLIPSYIPHVGYPRRGVPVLMDVPEDQHVMKVLTTIFEDIKSSNVLYAMREHDHEAFNEYCKVFESTYFMGSAITDDNVYFDVSVLDRNEDNAKFVRTSVNQAFFSRGTVGLERAGRLVQVLKDFGITGKEMKLAVTNYHQSDVLAFGLELCLALAKGAKGIEDVPPPDPLGDLLEYALKGPELLSEHLGESFDTMERLIEFLSSEGSNVRRNSMVMGFALRDKEVMALIENPTAMEFISAAMLYHSGVDVCEVLKLERDGITRLELAAIAGRLTNERFKDKKFFHDFFEGDVKETMRKFHEQPDTRAAMVMLNKASISQFKYHFDWFTADYTKGMQWTDYVIKGEKLEDAMGL